MSPGMRRTTPDRDLLKDWVAIVLAVGLCMAINFVCFAVLWDALRSDTPGLSENATQILTTAFGGIIGVLGSYIGYRAGAKSEADEIEREHESNGHSVSP